MTNKKVLSGDKEKKNTAQIKTDDLEACHSPAGINEDAKSNQIEQPMVLKKQYKRPIDMDSLNEPVVLKSLERILSDITYIPQFKENPTILKSRTIEYSKKISYLDPKYRYSIVSVQPVESHGNYHELDYMLYRDLDNVAYHLKIRVKYDPNNISLLENNEISPYFYLPFSRLSSQDKDFFYPNAVRKSYIHKRTHPISKATFVSFKLQAILGIEVIPSQLSQSAIHELLNPNKALLKSFTKWLNNLDQQNILNKIAKSFEHNKALKCFLQEHIFDLELNPKTDKLEPLKKDWFKEETVWIKQVKLELTLLSPESLDDFSKPEERTFQQLYETLDDDFSDGKLNDDFLTSDQNYDFINLSSFKTYSLKKVEAFQKLFLEFETNRNFKLIYFDSLQSLINEYYKTDLDEGHTEMYGIIYIKEQLTKIGVDLSSVPDQMEAPSMIRKLETLIKEHDFIPLLKSIACKNILQKVKTDDLSNIIFDFDSKINPIMFKFVSLPPAVELYDEKFRDFLENHYFSESRIEYNLNISFGQLTQLPDEYIYDLVCAENSHADASKNDLILRTIATRKFSLKLLDIYSDEKAEFWFKPCHQILKTFLIHSQKDIEHHSIIFLRSFQQNISQVLKDSIHENTNDVLFTFTLCEIFRSLRYLILELSNDFSRKNDTSPIERFNHKVLQSYLKSGIILKPVDIKNPIGLINIGNTCYLNSLLQFYFSVKPFRDMVLSFNKGSPNIEKPGYEELNEKFAIRRIGGSLVSAKQVEKGHQLMLRLKALFNEMIHEYSNEIKPSKELAFLAFHIGDLDFMYDSNYVNGCRVGKILFTDSDLAALTSERDVNECILNILNLVSASLYPEKLDTMNEQLDLVKELFYVKLKQETKTSLSNNVVTNFEYNSFISIPVKEFSRNLIDSLDEYFEEELIENSTIKTLGIVDPPEILSIHIQRAGFQEGAIIKSLKPLPFPDQIYLDKYMVDADDEKINKRRLEKEWRDKLFRCKKIIKHNAVNQLVFKRNLENSLKHLEHMKNLGLELSDQVNSLKKISSFYFQQIDECKREILRLEDLIDLNFKEDKYKKYKYNLVAIFIHKGNLASTGHYWVYIKDPQHSVYRKYNDDKVSVVDEQEVLQLMNCMEDSEDTPYLLIYSNDKISDSCIQPLMREISY